LEQNVDGSTETKLVREHEGDSTQILNVVLVVCVGLILLVGVKEVVLVQVWEDSNVPVN